MLLGTAERRDDATVASRTSVGLCGGVYSAILIQPDNIGLKTHMGLLRLGKKDRYGFEWLVTRSGVEIAHTAWEE